MDIDTLVRITSRAWSLNILASLDAGVPGRQAALLAATGASRTAFAQSLGHLVELGLLERNPGHGHPLRPEFRLTPKGIEMAAIAGQILKVGSKAARANGADEEDIGKDPSGEETASRILLRRAWTVPILVVCQTPRHFGEIRGALAPISDRALSQSLKQLHAHRWLKRTTDPQMFPPRPLYRADNAGLGIGAAPGAIIDQAANP
ncbi:winged helix-turn-helix transcriptional regulator [Pseudooceanicola algae]|uniref:HTH hxlR-type domain-containing protein n=1 Tax=Pseudooceanicola algae TaxID=1537215 RepID=A0A418SFN7_9RHOB|nr:winged helix-turn-helix transcriptional regulator [Pseudooceanicola algae]QPM91514.1 hypothetical protein PSAL_027670 [Pseudooceanicola algae]